VLVTSCTSLAVFRSLLLPPRMTHEPGKTPGGLLECVSDATKRPSCLTLLNQGGTDPMLAVKRRGDVACRLRRRLRDSQPAYSLSQKHKVVKAVHACAARGSYMTSGTPPSSRMSQTNALPTMFTPKVCQVACKTRSGIEQHSHKRNLGFLLRQATSSRCSAVCVSERLLGQCTPRICLLATYMRRNCAVPASF
jgi:hypothetical protein